MRIADIFSENLASPRQVVNADLVRKAIAIAGRADEFENRAADRRGSAGSGRHQMPAPFAQQQVIGGGGGLAAYFGIDVAVAAC